MNLVWVTSWDKPSRISNYSKELWPAVKSYAESRGGKAQLLMADPQLSRRDLLRKLVAFQPDMIHFQHEYGNFGGKNPPWYFFPALVTDLAFALPLVHMVATAHTVLPPNYRLPIRGRSLEMPLRIFANIFLLNLLTWNWGQRTWGRLDGVLVHRPQEVDWIKSTGSDFVEYQPHYVLGPEQERDLSTTLEELKTSAKNLEVRDDPTLVNFDSVVTHTITVPGYFAKDRGQDLAVAVLARLGRDVRLVLMGGARRTSDQAFLESCLNQARHLDVRDRVAITGFVNRNVLKRYLKETSVLLAPILEASGPGEILELIRYGIPVLCSNLEVVKEINALESGCIQVFKTGDVSDCTQKLQHLLQNSQSRNLQIEKIKNLSRHYSPQEMAKLHWDFYERALSRSPRAKEIVRQASAHPELKTQD